MPFFRLETNLPKDKIPNDFLTKTTAVLAKILEKPQMYCVAAVIPDTPFSWGGTDGPCGIGKLISIGKLGVEENKSHSAALFEHISKELGIPKDRMYLQFIAIESENMGYNGTTFHEIFGCK